MDYSRFDRNLALLQQRREVHIIIVRDSPFPGSQRLIELDKNKRKSAEQKWMAG
jgi:hypothetical protein